MASIRPKPPSLLTPDLGISETSYCRLCLVNNIGPMEQLHHNVSAPHIKKLQAHIRLRSQCTICRVHMSDIKCAEAHVQDSRHERRMNRDFNLKAAASVDQTYKCPPCGLLFKCSIALELHLFMTHKVRFSKENLPELSEIVWILSGLSSDASQVIINPECFLCEVKCEAMDDFLMHLISNVHMKLLRASTCLVCELKFIHVNDREAHLHGNKHKFHLQKFCLNNRRKKLKDMGLGENTRYICMYCMIWCKSWPCFMLHLLGNAHTLCAENQDYQHTNPAWHAKLQTEKVEIIQGARDSSIAGQNWKRWLDQSIWLSTWCLVCEEMLLDPEALEKHLEDHRGIQDMHMKRKHHWLNSLSKEAKVFDYFECEICCVIFKNELSLTVHKALLQHHIRQACVSNGRVICCCFDCRMQSRSKASEKSILPNPNSMIFDSRKLEENVTTVQNQCANELNSEVKKECSDKISKSGEYQGIKIVSEDKNNPGGHAYLGAHETSPRGAKAETDGNHRTNEQNLEQTRGFQEKKGLVPLELIQSGISPVYEQMVPVVIAAALPPSGSIHNNIHSALNLVKESLSAAVPKIRKHSTEVFSANKRLKGNNYDPSVDKHDCRSLKSILETAVSEGLLSLISHSSFHETSNLGNRDSIQVQEMTSSTCGSPMLSSVENVEGVSVAFAAAVIPQLSSTEIVLQTCTSKNHAVLTRGDHENEHELTNEKTCIGHQKINGARKSFQETNCLHDEKLSTQGSTQGINIIYEEDSLNSDDPRAYLSPVETEGSEG